MPANKKQTFKETNKMHRPNLVANLTHPLNAFNFIARQTNKQIRVS